VASWFISAGGNTSIAGLNCSLGKWWQPAAQWVQSIFIVSYISYINDTIDVSIFRCLKTFKWKILNKRNPYYCFSAMARIEVFSLKILWSL
jgi:hypothetical protein